MVNLALDHVGARRIVRLDIGHSTRGAGLRILQNGLPQQRGEQKARGDRLARPDARIGALERLAGQGAGDSVGFRLDARIGFRKEVPEQPVTPQQLVARTPGPGHEELDDFLVEPGRRHLLDQRRQLVDRAARIVFDFESELAGEPHRAQHPHRVLAIALDRVADEPQPAVAQVGMASSEIDDDVLTMIVVEAVHREVAAPCVLFERAVHVVAHDPPVDAHMVRIAGRSVEARSEGRDLDDLAAHAHVCEPESASDETAASEQTADGVRRRGGRDVEILRLEAEQQIPHASTDEIGAVAGVGQRLENFEGAPTDVGVGDAVLGLGDEDGLSDGAFDSGRFKVERSRTGRIIAVRQASPYLPDRAPFV